MRKSHSESRISLPVKLLGAVCLSALAAGCNSQNSRFSDGVFTGIVPSAVGNQTSVAGDPGGFPAAPGSPAVDPVNTGSVTPPASVGPRSSGSTLAAVPLPSPAAAGEMARDAGTPAAPSRGPGGWTATGGTRVTVGSGETIYNLSRRYGVPATEIMKANGITDASSIKVGQAIVIPQYIYGRNAPVSAPDNDPNTRNAAAGTVKTASVGAQNLQPSAASGAENSPSAKPSASSTHASSANYTVQSGDSLIRISKQTGASVEDIQRANGLSGSSIRVGQVLTIPGSGSHSGATGTANAAGKSKQAQPAKTATVTDATKDTQLASATPKTTGIDKLRWPVKGQVMTGFGANSNGRKSDGIDISVPEGTPVKAAENGVVIYAGSGLKEYGNTVLVRHDNGLVTVYGYASELTVQRGDKVTRGEVVALSGMSGDANRPKLHFEIRKDAKPVDPTTYLE